jgi:hypothetical protein
MLLFIPMMRACAETLSVLCGQATHRAGPCPFAQPGGGCSHEAMSPGQATTGAAQATGRLACTPMAMRWSKGMYGVHGMRPRLQQSTQRQSVVRNKQWPMRRVQTEGKQMLCVVADIRFGERGGQRAHGKMQAGGQAG